MLELSWTAFAFTKNHAPQCLWCLQTQHAFIDGSFHTVTCVQRHSTDQSPCPLSKTGVLTTTWESTLGHVVPAVATRETREVKLCLYEGPYLMSALTVFLLGSRTTTLPWSVVTVAC